MPGEARVTGPPQDRLQIIRESDDPIALRASIGGRQDVGYYLVYRGTPLDVLAMLREVLHEAEVALPAAPTTHAATAGQGEAQASLGRLSAELGRGD